MPHRPENVTVPAPTILGQSMDAFYRDLPELLKTRDGMWVAYHGDRCLGSAPTETELYQRCRAQGLSEDEFVVLLADRQALHDREPMNLPLDR